jgi:hypothetical protein
MGHISKIENSSDKRIEKETLDSIRDSLKEIAFYLKVISEKKCTENSSSPNVYNSVDTTETEKSSLNLIPDIEIGDVDL